MRPPEHSPRDLTDRVFRKTLENVHNLREFLHEALPAQAAAFEGDRPHPLLFERAFEHPPDRAVVVDHPHMIISVPPRRGCLCHGVAPEGDK